MNHNHAWLLCVIGSTLGLFAYTSTYIDRIFLILYQKLYGIAPLNKSIINWAYKLLMLKNTNFLLSQYLAISINPLRFAHLFQKAIISIVQFNFSNDCSNASFRWQFIVCHILFDKHNKRWNKLFNTIMLKWFELIWPNIYIFSLFSPDHFYASPNKLFSLAICGET